MIGYYYKIGVLICMSRLILGASKDSSGSDSSGKVWSVYLSEAERQDKALAENWKGDTEGILVFVCLRISLAIQI